MAKSKAKKQREHILRNGGYVKGIRGSWFGVKPITKKTPTLKQQKEKRKHKLDLEREVS